MKIFIIFVACFVSINGNRIAGGSTAFINQYPFAAALLTNAGQGEYQQACGGTILTTTAILSAASCFYTNAVADPIDWWRARVGSHFASSGGVVHLVNRITPHPDFLITTRVHDLAVLRTTIPITFHTGIVSAAHIAGAVFTLSINQPVFAIGWGATSATSTASEQLRHVQFWVVDQTTCANRYNTLGFTVTNNMVCVGWLDVGVRGQCEGDNGSPIVVDGVVAGVHSWSEGCAQGWYPGINTRLAPYTRWIVAAATAA